MKTAVVIGVGPNRGLGAQLCKRFAADGLNVVAAGRTQHTAEAVANDRSPRTASRARASSESDLARFAATDPSWLAPNLLTADGAIDETMAASSR